MLGKWADYAVAAGWVVAGALTCLLALVAMYVGAVPAPYWDQWGYTDPSEYLQHMMARHNEHPLVLGRILFAIDYWLGDARGWLLQGITYLALTLQVFAYAALAWVAGMQRPRSLAVLTAFSAVLVFSPHTWENLVWGFQVPFVAAYTGTAGAVASLAFYAERRARWILGLSFACTILAIVALSNGLLTPVLLGAMAWYLKLPRKITWAFVIIAVIAWPVFLLAPGGGAQGGEVGWKELPAVFIYTLRYISNGVINPFSQWYKIGGPSLNSLDQAIAVGELILSGALALLGHALLRRVRNPGLVGAGVLLLFTLGTAGLTALGRTVGFGPEQALSPRYGATTAMMLTSIAILATGALKVKSRWIVRGLLVGGLILALAVPVMAIPLIRDLTGQQRGRLTAQTSLIAGVRDSASIGNLAFDHDKAIEASAHLRAAGKWMFQDKWSRVVGSDVSGDIGAIGAGLSDCGGVLRIEPADTYWRVNGEVTRRWTHAAKIVLLVDSGGTLVGYGVVPRRASDLSPFGSNGAQAIDWQGHARANARSPLTAYLASPKAIACRIGAQGVG